MAKTTIFSLSLDQELNDRLRALASAEKRAMAVVVARLIVKGLAFERQHGADPVGSDAEAEEQALKILRGRSGAKRGEARA